jgi:protein-L-isoaspartate(D-aspartate) O-methyltransferase
MNENIIMKGWKVCGGLTLLFLLSAFGMMFPQQSQDEEAAFAKKRQLMVEEQLRARDITDRRVLEAMERVPRHLFIDLRFRREAYQDYPLPIEEGQTISQPYIVALMTQCLELTGKEKVLEVGTGSGYQAAVLAELADRIYTIEINEALAKKAAQTLRRLRYDRVEVKSGDGFFGWKEQAPFDAIIITCAASRIPPPLFEQLKEGGRLIAPLGDTNEVQVLTLVTKVKGQAKTKAISGVRFVPMTGEDKKRKK